MSDLRAVTLYSHLTTDFEEEKQRGRERETIRVYIQYLSDLFFPERSMLVRVLKNLANKMSPCPPKNVLHLVKYPFLNLLFYKWFTLLSAACHSVVRIGKRRCRVQSTCAPPPFSMPTQTLPQATASPLALQCQAVFLYCQLTLVSFSSFFVLLYLNHWY